MHYDKVEEYVFRYTENLQEKDHQSVVRVWRKSQGMVSGVRCRKELVRKVLDDKEKVLFLHDMVLQLLDDGKVPRSYLPLHKS